MLKISTGQVDITPEDAVSLSGYNTREGLSEGVLDRLLASVLVIEVGQDKICIFSYDIGCFDTNLSYMIRKRVSQKCSIDFDNILCTATHTHSAPPTLMRWFPDDVSPAYLELLVEKGVEAVTQAYEAELKEVTAFMSKGEIEGYYGNRNNKDAKSDKSVNILKFRDKNGELAASLVNMNCHSTVLGPASNVISGDLFGYLRNGLQEAWGATVLMSNGAGGDMSNRQYRQGNQAEELKRTGEGILSQILNFSEEIPITTGNGIETIKNFHAVHYVPDKDKMQQTFDDLRERLKTETNYDLRKLYLTVLGAEGLVQLEEPADFSVDSYIYKFGDVTIVTVPAELFNQLGVKIKEAAGTPYSIISGYTNELAGYLVEKSQYGKYFESFITTIPEGFPEDFTEKTIELL